MSQANPRVSVVIPVYNSEATLQRTVESVLRQTLTDLDLLIVDDGSTDGSAALAARLAATDPRVRTLQLPANGGKPAALNKAFAVVTGEWIAIVDADDWYEPERLQTLITAAETNKVPLAADNQTFHDAIADCAVRTAFPTIQGDGLLTRAQFIRGTDPFASFDYGMLKPVVRRDFVQRHGLAYREKARLAEDFLWLADFFAAGGTAWLIARPLYNWTQAFGGISRQWTTTGAGAWRYDFHAARDAHVAAAHELYVRKEFALANLLRRRARAFGVLHHMNEINRGRAQGASVFTLMTLALRHPSSWPRLAQQTLRSAMQRIPPFGIRRAASR
jgi:succinoglycan biosynthesis protein ExoO